MKASSHRPITYIIDYAKNHLDDVDSYVSRISESPPHLLHVGHDVPFPNTWGALDEKDGLVLIRPKKMKERIGKIERFTNMLHDAGVEMVIPYICNQTIAGDPGKRTGIWKFYDHWEDYSGFGFGPQPPDPVEWLAREESGRPHYNYEMRHRAFVPLGMQRYAPCPNNPHYRRYQKGIVKNIAKAGFDGVFVDNCVINCYCTHCQSLFQEHIQDHFSAQEQKEIFGFEDPSEIHLGTRGSRLHWLKTEPTFGAFLREFLPSHALETWLGVSNPEEASIEEGGNGWLWGMADRYLRWMQTHHSSGDLLDMFGTDDISQWGILSPQDRALWAETKLFWARSIADNLRFIRGVGESVRSGFLIVPNWGEMQLTDGNEFREEIGHEVRSWQPETDYLMFEESNEPGLTSPGIYQDFALEPKFALASDVKGAILSRAGQDARTTELSFAECLAGLGSFIQPGADFPGLRKKYRDFQEDRSELLDGWVPYYQVGLAYFYDQLHLENMEHMRQVHKFTRYLLDQHLLFHYVTEEDLSPQVRLPCRILILPHVKYVSDAQVEGLKKFLSAGGICFATGPLAACDRRARPREEALVESLSDSFPERFLWAGRIDSFLDDQDLSLDLARRLSRTTWRTLNVPGAQSFQEMRHVDEEIGIQRYLDEGRFMELVGERIDEELRVSPSRPFLGVRFNAYAKGTDLALHIVNYNVNLLDPPGERSLKPLSGIPLSLPIPDGFNATDLAALEPGFSEETLPMEVKSNTIRLTIPQLDFYKLILIKGSASR